MLTQFQRAHDCTAMVPRTDVMTVAMNLRTLATLVQFTLIIFFEFRDESLEFREILFRDGRQRSLFESVMLQSMFNVQCSTFNGLMLMGRQRT